MVAMRGHFDGKAIIPDEPVDLPIGQPLMVRVDTVNGAPPRGVGGASLLRFAGTIARADLEVMRGAIDADCGRVDGNGW